MIKVTVVPNALDPSQNTEHQVERLLPWLVERYAPHWPASARIYHRVGKLEWDITPRTKDDVRGLASYEGEIVIRHLPAGIDPITGGVAMAVWAYNAISDLISPDVPNIKPPAVKQRGLSGGSPNNELGRRSNAARPEQRIPDILGTVKSIPDLLMVPYTTYVDHTERETGYYCVSRGTCDLDAIRDSDTLISQIPGASAEVYLPGKAPTGGVALHEPELTIGDPIEDDVYNVYHVDAVNGQELFPQSAFRFYGTAFWQNGTSPVVNLWTYSGGADGVISLPFSSSAEEITDRLSVGDALYVYWPLAFIPPGAGTAPDLGTPVTATNPLTVTSLTVTSLTPDTTRVHVGVQIPVSQQAEWALVPTYFASGGGIGSHQHAQVTSLEQIYAGPFFVDFEHPPGSSNFEIVCNFVAPQGLYTDDGTTRLRFDVAVQVLLTPVDSSGTPTGAVEAFSGTIDGSAVSGGLRALTLRCKPSGFGTVTRCLVQARRLTGSPRREKQTDVVETDLYDWDGTDENPRYFSGRVVDEIRWTHCYSMSTPPNISFGDVTTIHTRTVATAGAVRVKNRELNCIASRMIRTWDGALFSLPLVANGNTENVLFHVMKDPFIGNVDDARIDFHGIVAAFAAVRTSVFSFSDLATLFAYTFDDADISLEETIQAICQSAFCSAYRDGPVIRVRPEIAGDDGELVINHRNVLPGTMKIAHSFGPTTEHDSVECGFTDPFDDSIVKVVVPTVGTTRSPKQLGIIGLRLERQAYWHAYRAYQKMLYQRQTVTLEATQEAGILGVRERVLIADLTRPTTRDGEILDATAAVLRTSQPTALDPAKEYTMYLQSPDGSVQEIAVASSTGDYIVTLASAPSPAPITDAGDGVKTTYILVADDEVIPRAYLVSSVQATSPLTHSVTAVNYSHMHYFADGLTTWVDFANGLVDLSPVQHGYANTNGVVGSGVWTGDFDSSFLATALPGGGDNISRSYTKVLWITPTSTPTESGLIQSGGSFVAGTDSELFSITTGDQLVAGHGGVFYLNVPYAAFIGAEHMVALTYDEPTGRMAMFIDGVLVDEATVPLSPLAGVNYYLPGFEGTCRELAKWGRSCSDREIMEFYLRGRP